MAKTCESNELKCHPKQHKVQSKKSEGLQQQTVSRNPKNNYNYSYASNVYNELYNTKFLHTPCTIRVSANLPIPWPTKFCCHYK